MEIPKDQIRWKVGNYHVGTPEEEVREEIEALAELQVKRGVEGWKPAHIKRCGDYAVQCHRENIATYRAVMCGDRSEK